MPRVIVNSTPLIVLSNIGQLDLLRKLYAEIFVPQAVFAEVTGTLGVLLRAKRENFIEKVTPLMSQLIAKGFYITPEVFSLVKSQAEE